MKKAKRAVALLLIGAMAAARARTPEGKRVIILIIPT